MLHLMWLMLCFVVFIIHKGAIDCIYGGGTGVYISFIC